MSFSVPKKCRGHLHLSEGGRSKTKDKRFAKIAVFIIKLKFSLFISTRCFGRWRLLKSVYVLYTVIYSLDYDLSVFIKMSSTTRIIDKTPSMKYNYT
jgi:hypothetical protein